MQHPEMSRRFSFFGFGESSNNIEDEPRNSIRVSKETELKSPILKVELDKNVYRPGDEVMITIEIQTPSTHEINSTFETSLLIERLSFELKGVEKLDSQWFSTQKPTPGSKHRRGENVFLDCSATSLVSNQIISSGASKKYVVRTVLPSSIPPSYRGTTIRYFYYIRSALSGQWLILENGHSNRDVVHNITGLESRVPLQIWVTQKGNGLMNEESQPDGIVPSQTIQTDIYWKEMDEDSEWARANDLFGAEEGYDSSRDEVSSLSSYNPSRENLHKSFGSSLSLQGSASRSFREPLHAEADEVLHNSAGDILSSISPPNVVIPSPQKRYSKSFSRGDDENGASSFVGTSESAASESYIRGRSYNIKLDEQVLLRFSPMKSDSNYCFSDMIGGTLTFFREEGTRRCLEVSITLEISETINRRFVHPSRRNSPTITKVHSDHHEVVADIVQTSFLFSVPMDGPMSFSTPHVSVQWALRFEFFTTPRNIDLSRYEHPLLVEGRDKCEWSLPITVHAPQPGSSTGQSKARKNPSFEPLWVRD